METNNKNNHAVLFVLLSLAIAAAHGVYAYFNHRFTESAYLTELDSQRDVLEQALDAQVENTTSHLLFIASIFAHDQNVQSRFLEGKQAIETEGGGTGKERAASARKALKALVSPQWNRALQGFEARQLHFHLEPGALSFLRVHKPEKYGDRLDDVRHIIVDVNSDQQPRTGFESGRVFSGLRGVIPVWAHDVNSNKTVHVGAVEIGTSYRQVLDALDSHFDVGAAVLLKKDHVESITWAASLQPKSLLEIADCNCILETTTRNNINALIENTIVQTGRIRPERDARSIDFGDSKLAIFFVPIRDYLGTKDPARPPVGVAIFWRDISQAFAAYEKEQRFNVVYAGLSFLLIEVLLILGFRLTTNTLKLRADVLSNRLNRISNQSPDAIYLIDVATARIIDVNDTGCQQIGYSKDELLKLHLWDISVLVEDSMRWEHIRSNVMDRQALAFEDKMRHRDGQLIAVEVNASCITEPQSNLFIATVRDITERKRSEAKLRASESLLRTTLDSTADGILVIGQDGRVLSANSRFQTLWSIPDDLLQSGDDDKLLDYVLGQLKQPQAFINEVKRLYNTEETTFDSLKFKNGKVFERYTVPLRLPNGLGRVWSFRDVTEKEQALTRLRYEKGFLKTLVQTLPDMIWLKDPDGVYLSCNPVFESFFGAKETEIIGRTDYDFVDRELADFFREHDQKAISKGEPSINEEWITFASDGHKSLLETTKTPMVDDQGQLIGILGIGHDITHRKQAEQAVLDSSRRYEAALSSTKDGFWLVDTTGQLLDVNEAYCLSSGFDKDELIGMRVSDLDAVQSPDDVEEQIKLVMAQGAAIFESRHRRKDGSTWPVEVSISYATIEGGRFFCFFRDIMERKQIEVLDKLRNELAELVYKGDKDQIMRKGLDTAEKVTQSQIGFFHFVEDDQETIALQVWSTRTLKEMCYAEGHGMHYPVSEAGVWVDCIHQRQPVIHNDYAALSHKKGMPEGHAKLLREAVVPVFRNNKIVAVMGVGNKSQNYDVRDENLISRVADVTYDFVERKQAEQRIEYMAYYDVLTDLPNRELLADRLTQAISHSRRAKKPLAVCYLDLDGFKPVNDQYGHHIGDVLLIKLAERLKSNLREGDTLARLGGDEFVLLLNDLTTLYDGEQIIHRILLSIKDPFEIEAHRILISGSIGATVYPMDKSDADTLLRHADQAMYKAKATGKSSYKLYDPLQDHKVHAHRQALEEFEHALTKGEIILHYQPKIDLHSGEVTGLEALARWQHRSKGMVPPGEFLPLIEGSPEEFLLGEWVLKTALDQHMAWRAQGIVLPISVNISPRHIQLQGFADHLARLLERYPDDAAQHLELEVLETSAIGDTAHVAEIMGACAELGVKFSLDDFGTGYSSLTYFHRLPINVLKIDQNFVRNMLDDVRDLDIVEGVLRLSEALKRPVVAEGVETIEIGMMLLQLGCRYAQGYGIAKPMPSEKVMGWLSDWKNSSPWHHLKEETEGSPERFDLNVSIFSHRHWLQQVVQGIETEDLATLPKLGEQHCQFGHWLKGIGQSRYGTHPSFPFIKPKHSQVHELATDIASLMRSGQAERAIARVPELKTICEELIALLNGLAMKQ